MGKLCPFCPGNEDKTPSEILAYAPPGRPQNKPGWWVRVVPNKFPALQIEGSLDRQGEGLYDKMNGIGAHEVLIETPDHKKEIPDLEDSRVEDIFWAYRDRIIDLRKDPRFEYILVFKNKGAAAGASMSHAHSQMIATPMVPQRVRQEMKGGKLYYDYKERCIFCDMIAQELEKKDRIVAENEHFVAIEPFAPRFPFETWILPKTHDSHFEDLQKPEAFNLSKIVKLIMTKIRIALDDPPFNYILHNSPLKEPSLPYYHWHIEIMPKLSKIAGFEWGTGFYINPTPPEEAAQFLKDAE
jgi:UDPglucose--hexose-1-phosphate uridylyltransferase